MINQITVTALALAATLYATYCTKKSRTFTRSLVFANLTLLVINGALIVFNSYPIIVGLLGLLK